MACDLQKHPTEVQFQKCQSNKLNGHVLIHTEEKLSLEDGVTLHKHDTQLFSLSMKESPSLYLRPLTMHSTGHRGQHCPTAMTGDSQGTGGHSTILQLTDPF